ncbi:diaminopimelate epimerase [Xylella taiwanensis]|nr:diaminopimelate epimerase [Xylella taiwanensis]AXI83891.1 diaminopimelate epimerase [Xylella taiwanensis]MCD8456998.1 diaminopimelate epimerase [Xylella taiwanensis]MCD8459409.1 diaminopimelate epimerase [Xylella taiwanensis]MCD8461722.1 diaminopimelate epimerase [Xylella taiwanensis]MCD8462247.1 diaminopimelate epimerase [Xylella taiwanensis]
MGIESVRCPLHFTKMHGAGNDFVILDLRDGTPLPDAALVACLADRHFGVGCDQILTIESPRSVGVVAAYRIWNADGSQAQQCGNGARCVAAWLVRDGSVEGAHFLIDSPVQEHLVHCIGKDEYAVEMGVPIFEPERIPLAGFSHFSGEYLLSLQGEALCCGVVSMGNPHAVIEVDLIDAAPVERIGPLLQQHAAFPESVNVGFVQVIDPGLVRLRVYERGSGETLACGSGACAAAVVLMQRGRVGRDVHVVLPGGTLRVQWPVPAGPVTLSGPAMFVFDGVWYG